MDNVINKPPSSIHDTVELICAYCKKIAYQEIITAVLDIDNNYKYTRVVSGSFSQDCNNEGIPTGPVLAFCNCRGNN